MSAQPMGKWTNSKRQPSELLGNAAALSGGLGTRLSPAVIRRMARLHRDEHAGRRRAYLSTRAQLRFYRRAILGGIDHVRDDLDLTVGRRRPAHLDGVLRGDHCR